MKKIFTLICALAGFAGAANAASVDDLAVCKHSYVLVCDDYTNNGAGPRTKGGLFGDGYFLDVTGGSVATNKGSVNLSVLNEADDNHVTQYIVDKYGAAYPDAHFNSLRLKNAQDVIAMKVTQGSKLIFFLQGNNKTGKEARIPKIATDAKLENALNKAPDENFSTTDAGFRYEWTADNDYTLYIGSYNGDMFLSYIIVEANEPEGTPSVKVGNQTYEGGLWYREVTCTPGLAYGMPTEVYYTTDGTAPTSENGTLYSEPIKCYKEQMVKFQAFFMGTPISGADNEAPVSFSFNAPAINDDGANVTIVSEYEGAKNFVTLDGNLESAEEMNEFTLTSSATVTAYSTIQNGEYATFTTKTSSKEVYVLSPIKTQQTLTVTGDIVENPDKAADTDPNFIVENGKVNATNEECFFIRNTGFKVVEEAGYQVPVGQQAYLMMNGNIITFEVAEGDSVDVVVTCSKNACKNIELTDEEVDAEGSKVANDRKCFINVDGKNYSAVDAEGNEAADLKRNPDANIVKFGLGAGIHTFQKYSGTGNILVSSIEIIPAEKQEGVLGDVNGDGKVDVEDVVGIVNKILGEPAEGFIEANADVNGDSKIDVDDVVAAVNIILGDTNE